MANFLKLSFILLGISGSQLTLGADDYLKQLEMEANMGVDDAPEILNTNGSGPSSSTSLDSPSTEVELILDKKELIVDINSFEKALKKSYRESYGLYQQLSDTQKESVYKDFTQHKRLYNSSVKTISTYLGTH